MAVAALAFCTINDKDEIASGLSKRYQRLPADAGKKGGAMSTGMQHGLPVVGYDELKRSWGWLVGVGIALIVLGVIALGTSVLVTLVSVEVFGWLVLIGGILSAAHAFWRRHWGGFFIELFAGILYVVVGLMIVANPAESALALTLLIALFLMIGGVLRIVTALMIRFHHSVWVLLNGIVSLLLGVMIWRQWPVSGLWVIGLFIGIDLIFYGWSLVMLGLFAKKLPAQAV
jgi:uncharacterized membrane protein HdeD (DUF308 family)